MDRPNPQVPGPLLFLSHAGADTEPARQLKVRLETTPEAKTAGLRVWFDKDNLLPGHQSWQAQLEQAIERAATAFAVYVGSKGVINWVEAEVRLALSRATSGDAQFPFIPVIAADAAGSSALPGFARQFQSVRDVENKPGEFQKLLAAVLGRSDKAGKMAAETNPFFGLRAIDEDRSHLFFGREQETDDLIRRLRDERLLMVTGDSGSGKSSLVKAGVVPHWHGGVLAELDGRRPDEDIWHVIAFRPRSNPRRMLSEAVLKAASVLQRPLPDQDTYRTWAMDDDPERRRQGLRCGLDPTCTRTLVFVDQLEELVTLTPRDQRQPFIELLLDLADPADPAFAVVLTMRRDY
ncbi:MAG: toll/interleukin-1 receptor domain-containing protein [Rhodopila sp.]